MAVVPLFVDAGTAILIVLPSGHVYCVAAVAFISYAIIVFIFFFFQAEDGIRDKLVTGVQTCALPSVYMSVDAPGSAWESGGIRERFFAYGNALLHPQSVRWSRLFHTF